MPISLAETVHGFLREAFGEQVRQAPEEGSFFVPLGRTGVGVNVSRVGADNEVVDVYSWIARGLAVTNDVESFLLRKNSDLRFGALCVDAEGAILFQHALFSEGVDRVVLERLVQLMAATADELDDELKKRFS